MAANERSWCLTGSRKTSLRKSLLEKGCSSKTLAILIFMSSFVGSAFLFPQSFKVFQNLLQESSTVRKVSQTNRNSTTSIRMAFGNSLGRLSHPTTANFRPALAMNTERNSQCEKTTGNDMVNHSNTEENIKPTINGGNTSDIDNNQKVSTRVKVMGFVGIQTGFGSVERRKAVRETWLGSTPDKVLHLQEGTGLKFCFILGKSHNALAEITVQKEIDIHQDFIRIDEYENYKNLNHKTLSFFKTVFTMYDAKFYVKVDDDVYLRPDRLSALLSRKRDSDYIYLGCMKKGPVIKDPHFKWFEPKAYMLGNEYFLHAYGPIYALSQGVVSLLHSAQVGSLRMFMNEDVTVGSWMLAWNVSHEDNRYLCQPACSPKSIAVWDIPTCSGLCNAPTRLRELHKSKSC